MGKIYKGYELMEAIAEGKIKEGTKFEFINNINGVAVTVIIQKDSMNRFILINEDFDNYLCANWLIDTTIKQLEDEIDIQSIEELDTTNSLTSVDARVSREENLKRIDETLVNNFYKINGLTAQQNMILQWAKQIDKKIKEKEYK